MLSLRSKSVSPKRRALSTFLSIVALGAAALPVAAQDGDSTSDAEDEYQNGSYLVVDPGFLLEGSLDVRITGENFEDSFSAEAIEQDAYPGTLLMEGTPYGDVFVYDTGNPSSPDYILGFVDYGVSTALTPVGASFVGTYGGLTFDVAPTPVAQGPQGPQGPTVTGGGRVQGVPGWDWIRITEPCPGARFRQFVAISVEWKGTMPGPNGPVDTSGTSGGTGRYTGNNGSPMDLDGGQSYVDSNNGVTGGNTPAGYDPTNNGDYPARTNGNSTSLEDAPNTTNPNGIVGDIQNANPGVTVTEITITMRFTTYVIKNGVITHKVKWTAVETITIPAAVPDLPGPGYGGPAAGPGQPPFTGGGIPTVTPANGMEPQHTAAHNNYLGGNFGGAPSVGGY